MLDGLDYDRMHYAEELIQDSRERWPWAWRGCVAAWAPSVGRTGLSLLDWSGGRKHGTLVNSPTWTPARDGYDLAFTASGYVTMGNVLGFERTEPRSVFTWIKTTSTSYSPLISKLLSSGNFRGWELSLTANSTGTLSARIISSTGSPISRLEVHTTATVNDGSLHFVGFTYDGSSAAAGVNLYIDGAERAKTVVHDSLDATILNSVSVNIGARDNGNSPYTGNNDDSRIYNRVLAAEEVRDIHRLGRGGLYRLPQRTMSYRALSLPTFRPWRGRQNQLLGGGIV